MKINIHILAEIIAEKDPSIINIHEVDASSDDNIEITYDVVVPAKKILISKADYRKYLINGKIDSILGSEED
ncbi:hypothetical protein CRYO30217_00007 [Parvicella tangerina]|uniref:Uncharacterized protein n=1 Tax=Parvicella tangerina TaxID=2829795 RepID=A0A916JI33_9FLAO|nr:hypothetical protein CRYO30217_00007 [Parvicella tangerina]